METMIDIIRNCWNFIGCDESCPYYDCSPDEGFHCERYKSFSITDKLFDDMNKLYKDEWDKELYRLAYTKLEKIIPMVSKEVFEEELSKLYGTDDRL